MDLGGNCLSMVLEYIWRNRRIHDLYLSFYQYNFSMHWRFVWRRCIEGHTTTIVIVRRRRISIPAHAAVHPIISFLHTLTWTSQHHSQQQRQYQCPHSSPLHRAQAKIKEATHWDKRTKWIDVRTKIGTRSLERIVYFPKEEGTPG